MPGYDVEVRVTGKDDLSSEVRKGKNAVDELSSAADPKAKRKFATFSLGAIAALQRIRSYGIDIVRRGLQTIAPVATRAFSIVKKAVLAAGAAITAAGAALIKFGMDAVESENLFVVAMGAMADKARDWTQRISDALGLNAYQLRTNVAEIFVMSQSMGLGTDAAYAMARGISQLSYDMASFYNQSPAEIFEKLRSGITGEAEPLKRLGILVTDNFIKQTNYARSINATGREMTEAEKVIARYNAILEQTAKAQGDLDRTLDSPTNKLRRMWEQIKNITITIGLALVNSAAFQQVIGWMGDRVKSVNDVVGKMDWDRIFDKARIVLVRTRETLADIEGGTLRTAVASLKWSEVLVMPLRLLLEAAYFLKGYELFFKSFGKDWEVITNRVASWYHYLEAGFNMMQAKALKLLTPWDKESTQRYTDAAERSRLLAEQRGAQADAARAEQFDLINQMLDFRSGIDDMMDAFGELDQELREQIEKARSRLTVDRDLVDIADKLPDVYQRILETTDTVADRNRTLADALDTSMNELLGLEGSAISSAGGLGDVATQADATARQLRVVLVPAIDHFANFVNRVVAGPIGGPLTTSTTTGPGGVGAPPPGQSILPSSAPAPQQTKYEYNIAPTAVFQGFSSQQTIREAGKVLGQEIERQVKAGQLKLG